MLNDKTNDIASNNSYERTQKVVNLSKQKLYEAQK